MTGTSNNFSTFCRQLLAAAVIWAGGGSAAAADQLDLKVKLPGAGRMVLAAQFGPERLLSSTKVSAAEPASEQLLVRSAAVRWRGMRSAPGRTRQTRGITSRSSAYPEYQMFFAAVAAGRRRDAERLRSYEVYALFNESNRVARIRVRKGVPHSARRSRGCPLPSVPAGADKSPMEDRTAAADGEKLLTIALTVDSRFYALYGADTPQIVAAALADVEAIYHPQLAVQLRYAGQTIYADRASDPFGAKVSYLQLLDNFQDAVIAGSPSDSVDLYHLLTSGRGYTAAVGLAFIGSVCRLPAYRMGWTDYSNGYIEFVETLAHEIGHSLGAGHDSADPQSIMNGVGRGNATAPYFSDFSKSQIAVHIGEYGSCLLDSDGAPLPTPEPASYPLPNENSSVIKLSLGLNRSSGRGVLSGVVRSTLTGRLSGRVIELRRSSDGRLLKTAFSDRKGQYRFVVRKPAAYYTVDRMSLKTSRFSYRYP